MNESYFIDNISRVIDYYSKGYGRVIIMGDFNLFLYILLFLRYETSQQRINQISTNGLR